jgi:hypothetical protein
LSDLALERCAASVREKFCRLTNEGGIVPVFSFAHVYETLNYQNEPARRVIASFSDSLPNRRWILSMHELMRRETAQVFHKCVEKIDVPFDVFFDSLRHLLYSSAPEPIELIVENFGFQRFIEIISKSREIRAQFQHWHDYARMLPIAQSEARTAAANPARRDWPKTFRRIMQSSMCGTVPDRLTCGRFVSRQERENFERDAPWGDFQKWPAVYLFLKVCEAVALGLAGDVKP